MNSGTVIQREMNSDKGAQVPLPMNGGLGHHSYSKNSSIQRSVAITAKTKIREAILDKLDINQLPNANPFKITDLGCSTGPNTFVAVQNIIESVSDKYKDEGLSSQTPEFQVFFSDLSSNDFNTLIASLPPQRPYFPAAVPGSMYTRLFPEQSIHFVYSAYALQYLSRVPEEVVDMKSPAWNKGRVHYTNAPSEVVEAYTRQYAKDMDGFLDARAKELVDGGLMALIFPVIPNETHHSHSVAGIWTDLLGSTLMDMAMMGLVNEALVDSFNVAMYTPPIEEIEASVKRNGCFRIEQMEGLAYSTEQGAVSNELISKHMRAALEGLITKHFGQEIIEELFQMYAQKLAESSSILKLGVQTTIQSLLVLRKVG